MSGFAGVPSHYVNVTATSEEARAGAMVGVEQCIARHQYGRSLDHGRATQRGSVGYRSEQQKWANTIMGRIGEVVAARVLGLAWQPGGAKLSDASDLSDKTEVRWTEHEGGHLTVYETDKDHYWVALVTGSYPVFRVYRPVPVKACKARRWWRRDMNLYWVPEWRVIEMIQLASPTSTEIKSLPLKWSAGRADDDAQPPGCSGVVAFD